MGFGNFGIWEMLLIAVFILIFFGPNRLPEISRSVGKALREFRRGVNEIQREIELADRDTRKATSDRSTSGSSAPSPPGRGRASTGATSETPAGTTPTIEPPGMPTVTAPPAGADPEPVPAKSGGASERNAQLPRPEVAEPDPREPPPMPPESGEADDVEGSYRDRDQSDLFDGG